MWICGCCATRCAASRSARSTICETGGLPQPDRSDPCATRWPVTFAGRWPTPSASRRKDIWDLALFGHRGYLSFTGIAQPWLAQAAKRWAAEQLPRHRGGGAARVRGKINGLGLLSEYLRLQTGSRTHPGGPGPPRRRGLPQPAGLSGVDRQDQPLPPQRHLPRRAGGLGRDPRPGPDPTRRARGRAWPETSPSSAAISPPSPNAASPAVTCHRRSWPRCAPTSTPCSRPRSGPPPSSASTPGADPKTSSACHWTAWTATKTAAPYWSTTTSKPTGWAGGCRSARPPPQ